MVFYIDILQIKKIYIYKNFTFSSQKAKYGKKKKKKSRKSYIVEQDRVPGMYHPYNMSFIRY